MAWHSGLAGRRSFWGWWVVALGVTGLHLWLVMALPFGRTPSVASVGAHQGQAARWHATKAVVALAEASPAVQRHQGASSGGRGSQARLNAAPMALNLAESASAAAPSPAHYFGIDEVDTLPVIPEDLDYGRMDVLEWRLTLRIWVSEEGRIDHAEVFEAQPPGPWVTQVLQALTAVRVTPARLAGVDVPVQMDIQLGPETIW